MTNIIQAEPIQYWVEVSVQPNRKSRYTRRNSFTSLSTAELYYSAINIGLGYRKRLRAFSPTLNHFKIIRRSAS